MAICLCYNRYKGKSTEVSTVKMNKIVTKETEPARVQRLYCPRCGESAGRIGLLEGGVLVGLSISCRNCHVPFRADTVSEKGESRDG